MSFIPKKKISKKSSKAYFSSKIGVAQLKNVGGHVSAAVADVEDDGYTYFSQHPTYGVNYLHDSVGSVYPERTERQLRSSYIVDEDGGIIRVD
jgi:hypothetical protein